MTAADTTLPCGRTKVPSVEHFHCLDGQANLGVVINNLTGAWLGGKQQEIRRIFQHLTNDAIEGETLSEASKSEIAVSQICDMPRHQPVFRPHLAVVHVGHVCNIDCTYCYAPKTTGAMSADAIERVTDFLAQVSNPIFVQFMGGEPLIYRDQIAILVEKLNHKRAGLETTYGVQTNGLYLLDDGVMEFLDDRNIRFGISYDGPGTMSEARFEHRLTFLQDKFERTVRELKARDYNFGILAVLNQSNKGRLPELVDWCIEREIRHLLVNPLLLGQGKDNSHALPDDLATESMGELFRYWVDNELYKQIDIENFQAFENNITDLNRQYMCRKQQCGAGREQLAFDTTGNIFPCDYLVGEQAFCLGNTKDLGPEEIEHSSHMRNLHDQVQPQNLRECGNCPMFSYCGNCMASSHFRDGTLNGRRGSCHTDFNSIQDIIFELLTNEDYCEHVLSR